MLVETLTSSNLTAEVPAANRWHEVAFTISGTFDGGSVAAECQPYHNASWIPMTDSAGVALSWSSASTGILDISEKWGLRFVISGGAGSESVLVTAQKINQ